MQHGPAFECLSAQMSYRGMGTRQPRFRGVPGRGGELPSGRPRRDHAAEHARLSGHVPRRAARRHDGGQRQPALHAARIATAARRFRRRRHRDHGEFRPQAAGNPRRHEIRHVVVARLGDFVPMLKRWAFNFANSYIAHAVPAWHFETFTMLQDACESGAERALPGRAGAGERRRPAAIYRRDDRASPKGAMLTHRNLVANTLQCLRLDRRRRAAEARARAHAAAALSHLLADGEPAELCGARRAQLPHSRSARSAPAHPHHARRQDYLDVRRQHAVQCARQYARIRRTGFQRVARRDRRRRRRAKRSGAALARDHRQRVGRRLWPDRSFAGRLHQSVSRTRSSAPSACRCPRPK